MPVAPAVGAETGRFAGSASCRDCHQEFYHKWSTSHHGLAMQPFTVELARRELKMPSEEIAIGQYRYRAEMDSKGGWVQEEGPEGKKNYPMVHAMGGKDIYYFLTPLEKGRLQVLPLAYDVREKKWYDTAASAVRHFPMGAGAGRDEALNWKDRPYTFNSSYFSCHVSQLATNYDLKTDSYHTVWGEAGINCETCHESAVEHVRVMREAKPGQTPADWKIVRVLPMSIEQKNSLCAPCHAKMSSLTEKFRPGDRYFDHFDLATLENPDFYPDGRDLGENYTYTSWRMSPCAISGKLDCTHCHTSSGRYRFAGVTNPDGACLPCHKDKVDNAPAHTRHAQGSEGSRCISCHMPMTTFARMRRSDHSMRPPTPAATIAFKSPNACNICHTDKDAAWADKLVRQWHPDDYQKPVLERARLIDAARRHDWSSLPAMLASLQGKDRDEIYATSMLRLLQGCESPTKWPVALEMLKDPSPLVRSAAVSLFEGQMRAEWVSPLLDATGDDYRLVRIRAATVLSGIPIASAPEGLRKKLEAATTEYLDSLKSRQDDPRLQIGLGNFYMNRNDLPEAAASFENAIRLDPRNAAALVNVSLVYNAMGRNDRAEQVLREALRYEPANVSAQFNLGLLLGEMNRPEEAKAALRAALKGDPRFAAASYNLGILMMSENPVEGLRLCRNARDLAPQEPKYAQTLAYFLRQQGDEEGANEVLRKLNEGR